MKKKKLKIPMRRHSGRAIAQVDQKRGVRAASSPARKKVSTTADGVAGRTTKRANARVPRPPKKLWQLRLYVAGQTARSQTAFRNLSQICENHLKGLYHIEVVDLLEKPMLSKGDQILAIPTLVRRLPKPVRKIVGDLSDTERVLVGLDLRPAPTFTRVNQGERRG